MILARGGSKCIPQKNIVNLNGKPLIQYIIDSAKIRNELNWKPKIGFEQGLNEVILWVEENFDELQKFPG